jgi:succinate dehydrogenase/fumarate reductase flavoprotein subunit
MGAVKRRVFFLTAWVWQEVRAIGTVAAATISRLVHGADYYAGASLSFHPVRGPRAGRHLISHKIAKERQSPLGLFSNLPV